MKAIICLKREYRIADQVQRETAYYITSLAGDAQKILNAVRCHWSIENSLHWVMDVTFREDDMRTRQPNSSQNMVVLRHIALNILKKDKSKGSLKQKRYTATLNDTFLLKLLQQL